MVTPEQVRAQAAATLGVAPDAPAADVKSAFRASAKQNHADVGGDSAVFDATKKAYDVLSNPKAADTEAAAQNRAAELAQARRAQNAAARAAKTATTQQQQTDGNGTPNFTAGPSASSGASQGSRPRTSGSRTRNPRPQSFTGFSFSGDDTARMRETLRDAFAATQQRTAAASQASTFTAGKEGVQSTIDLSAALRQQQDAVFIEAVNNGEFNRAVRNMPFENRPSPLATAEQKAEHIEAYANKLAAESWLAARAATNTAFAAIIAGSSDAFELATDAQKRQADFAGIYEATLVASFAVTVAQETGSLPEPTQNFATQTAGINLS